VLVGSTECRDADIVSISTPFLRERKGLIHARLVAF
jgi:hypothetical protein